MAREDIERRLGPPAEVVTGSNGKSVADYYFHEYRRSEDSSRYTRYQNPGSVLYRTVSLLDDNRGVMERKVHDESITPLRRDWNQWIEIGPSLTAQTLNIAKGGDTAETLTRRFGEPISRGLDPHGHTVLRWYNARGRVDRLGEFRSKLLTVVLENGVVTDFALSEADPRFWPYSRWLR